MKQAYLDCFSGISGDMTLGALVDAGCPVEHLRSELSGLRVPGWELSAEKVPSANARPDSRHPPRDRKSTRLNSSHSQISHAVFCLKKKNAHKILFLGIELIREIFILPVELFAGIIRPVVYLTHFD